ncbi:ABC transporter substrate-binding protein [Alkalinema sp. FACHB-956]|uniref:ABC transporter substrate-binding protein n=1 Tax=Alkalinema sp. FACHB-956 TaxID=2692768 RepID=UPI0016829695|nr:ABC transporter substrate-binding protein [Alkalinema sp. FACHB-956]
MNLKRRNLLLGLVGATVPVILSSCASEQTGRSSSSSSPTASGNPSTVNSSGGSVPDKIRIGYQVIPNGELLVKALGLAAKAFPNSQVQYTSFDSGRDVNTAIAANGIDFGLVGSVPASVGIAQGLAYQVYFIHDIIGSAEALIGKNGVQSIADLKGKKVATPFGSTAHFSLESLLLQEKIDQKDVTILDLQPPDIVAAWQRGDIDASYVWEPNLGKLKKDGGQIITTSADVAKKGIITADVGVVRKEFAEKYPDVVKQYISLLDEAVKLYRTDPKTAIAALAKEINITPADTEAGSNGVIWLDSSEQKEAKYLGAASQPGDFAKILKSSADFAVTQKKINSAPDLATYQQAIYTNK